MHDDGDIALRLDVQGHVQGVSYRASAQRQGERLGLRGWVRNRSDGSVEALVAGPRAKVAEFVDWARHGPPHASVTRVHVSAAALPETDAFSIAPTA